MPADSLLPLRGLDSRETLIEAAAVLSVAIQDPHFVDGLNSVYQPSETHEILGVFSLRMPSIFEGSLDAPPDYVLGECLKVLEASDVRDVPLAAALVTLNLYGLGRLGPVADVAVEALWPKIWGPIAQFLRSACSEAGVGKVEDGSRPKPPVMALPNDDPYSWNPHDASMLGDYTMWARGVGPMFHSLAGWDSAWAMPPRPVVDACDHPWRHEDLTRQVAYWTPLAQLAIGPMGWTDPALGIARWILRGMPISEPSLRFLSEVWAGDALMFFTTTRDWVPMIDESGIFVAGARGAERLYSSLRRKQQLIGSGGFHLSHHLVWQMFGEVPSNLSECEASAQVFRSGGSGDGAVLMLQRFAGWYRNLELLGRKFPDGSKISVIAPPVGYLGKFKRDSKTRRWHSVSTFVHRWGN